MILLPGLIMIQQKGADLHIFRQRIHGNRPAEIIFENNNTFVNGKTAFQVIALLRKSVSINILVQHNPLLRMLRFDLP
ncbi:hypothetical protein D3C71_2111420 [compost metagenome]